MEIQTLYVKLSRRHLLLNDLCLGNSCCILYECDMLFDASTRSFNEDVGLWYFPLCSALWEVQAKQNSFT